MGSTWGFKIIYNKCKLIYNKINFLRYKTK